MDWVDEQIERFKNEMRMKSLRKTLIIYIFIASIVVIILYLLNLGICNSWKRLVYKKYSFDMYSYPSFKDINSLPEMDKIIIQAIKISEKYSIVFFSIIAMIITTNMFFKNRFKEPLNILKEEAKSISHNNLSFPCVYNSGDEMGEICEIFDKMRIQLTKNNENMWSLMEGQRQLNSAFAHNLRNPLTVIQGYVELLIKYYPEGVLSDKKIMEIYTLIQAQIDKLKDFSTRMKGIQDIESMDVKPKLGYFKSLEKKINDSIDGIMINSKIEIKIHSDLLYEKGHFDECIILQVVDNLLSNALFYGKSTIDIFLELNDDFLTIYVRDDGKGFSKKDLYYALRPYYSSRYGVEGHLGIGLTICKILCEKHGGRLTLNNSTKGGAIVCASFFTM